jgi:ABC-2 type transport system permease protein
LRYAIRWIRLALRRAGSMSRKELMHILRDKSALFLVIFAPAIVLGLLSYVFAYDANESNLAVVDLDQTPLSAEYVRTLTSDGHLHVVATPGSYEEATALLQSGRADAALIIPRGFAADLIAGSSAPLHNVVDGVDTSAARAAMRAVEQRTRIFAAQQGFGGPPPIDVRIRIWFNENLDPQDSMVPALIALVLILPAMAGGLSLTREKETGTLETLVTTPVLGSDVLIGKLVVYLALGLVGGLLCLGVALFWFRVPFRGDLGSWLGATALYLLACMAFSLMVSNFTASQQTTMAITLMVLFMPGFLMSGLSDPIDAAWTVSRVMAYFLPTTHYIALSRGITLKGLTLIEMWPHVLALVAIGVAGLGAAVGLFRKKIA